MEEKEVELEDLTEEQRNKIEGKIQKYLKKLVPPEKRGLFTKKPVETSTIEETSNSEKKIEKEAFSTYENALIGKYMLREMPFFRFEMIIIFAMLIIGILAWYLDYREIIAGASRIFLIAAILVPFVIWLMKWMFFMPRKNKVPGLKLYKSGIVELGIYDITKGYITFGRGENIRKKFITKINKHVEASTGRPFVVVSELEGENLNLLKTDKPDMRSEEFCALLEMNTTVTTKNVMARMLRFGQANMSNPMMLLQILSIALIAFLVLKQLGVLDFIG